MFPVLFEMISGLKVKFNKNMLVGVNIPSFWLRDTMSALRCKMGNVPFVYPRLSIGGNSRRLDFWEPIMNHIKHRE
jgi:hypothetical protein